MLTIKIQANKERQETFNRSIDIEIVIRFCSYQKIIFLTSTELDHNILKQLIRIRRNVQIDSEHPRS